MLYPAVFPSCVCTLLRSSTTISSSIPFEPSNQIHLLFHSPSPFSYLPPSLLPPLLSFLPKRQQWHLQWRSQPGHRSSGFCVQSPLSPPPARPETAAPDTGWVWLTESLWPWTSASHTSARQKYIFTKGLVTFVHNALNQVLDPQVFSQPAGCKVEQPERATRGSALQGYWSI